MTRSTTQGQFGKRRLFQMLAALGAAGLLSHAAAQSPGGHGGPGMGERARMGSHSGEAMAERRIDHIIKQVDGTPEQKAKLTQLAQAAQKDMQPVHEQLMAARKKAMDLLAAPTIDRAALEKLRTEQNQLTDNLSRRRLSLMADSAEVLTPAQRSKLAEKMKARGEHGERGGRGGHRGMHGMHGSDGQGGGLLR